MTQTTDNNLTFSTEEGAFVVQDSTLDIASGASSTASLATSTAPSSTAATTSFESDGIEATSAPSQATPIDTSANTTTTGSVASVDGATTSSDSGDTTNNVPVVETLYDYIYGLYMQADNMASPQFFTGLYEQPMLGGLFIKDFSLDFAVNKPAQFIAFISDETKAPKTVKAIKKAKVDLEAQKLISYYMLTPLLDFHVYIDELLNLDSSVYTIDYSSLRPE